MAVGFFDPVMDNLARKRMYEEGLKEGKQEEMKKQRQVARTMLERYGHFGHCCDHQVIGGGYPEDHLSIVDGLLLKKY